MWKVVVYNQVSKKYLKCINWTFCPVVFLLLIGTIVIGFLVSAVGFQMRKMTFDMKFSFHNKKLYFANNVL